MAGENVGVIYYSVDADTSKAVSSADKLDDSLDKLENQFGKVDAGAGKFNTQLRPIPASINKIGAEANATSSALGGMGKVFAGILTLQGVKSLIDMAEAYGEMSERVKMATADAAEFEMVQQRLLVTANTTYRTLAETSEVYIRTADSLRSMGYSTEVAMDTVDSLSYLFVTNATSADRANNAISAFTKSLNKGKVEVDAWETLIAAVPSIIGDIATATGKSAAEIRELGVSGGLTASMLTTGLQQSLEKNRDAAADMATNLKDAFRAVSNSLSVYLGEANNATGATGVLSGALVEMSKHIGAIVTTLTVLGAGVLAKYIASTTASAVASAQAVLATRAQAIAQVQLAQAQVTSTAAAAANAAATAGLTTSFSAATTAATAHTAAVARLAVAQKAAAASGATLLGLFGGPVGLIALAASAAAGLLLYVSSSDKAKASMLDMASPLDQLIDKFNTLTESQRQLAVQQANLNIAESVKELGDALSDLARGAATDGTAAMARWRGATAEQTAELVKAAEQGKITYSELDSALVKLITDYAKANGRSQEWINAQIQIASEVSNAAKNMQDAQAKANALTTANNNLANASRNAASGQRDLNTELFASGSESGKYLQTLTDRANKLRDGNSAVKEAQRYLSTLSEVTEEYRAAVMKEATAIDRASAAKKTSAINTKEESEAKKQQRKINEETTKSYVDNIEAVDKLAQELMLASLSGEELAVTQAVLKLNEYATPEQVAQVRALGAELYKANELAKSATKFGDDPAKYIRGTVTPLQGGAFDDQTARYDAEAEAERVRYQEQLERLKAGLEAQRVTREEYANLEFEFAQTHAQRMGQIEQAKMQVMLAAGEQGFGAIADMLKQSAGEQSGIYKAMFAASKAFAIAQAIVSIQQGIAQAAANPFPANLAAMASVAAATAGLVSNISSVTMGGGRQYGGPVHAGAMHRVNENGQPEVLNMANGRQYLLPGSSGGNVQPLGGVNGAQTSTSAGGNTTIHVSVKIDAAGGESVQATATPGYEKFARDVGALIDERFKEHEMNSYKQGGMSWDAMNGRIR